MIEQSRLRDINWTCTNAQLDCQAVLPCFDAAGRVVLLLVVTQQWGWLLSPPGRLTRRYDDLVFAGPLEELFRLSPKAMEQMSGLHYYDPNWVVRGADFEPAIGSVLHSMNLAGAVFGKLPITRIAFDDGLRQVEVVEVGQALWRRPVALGAFGDWLRSNPRPAGGGAGQVDGVGVVEPDRPDRAKLYEPTAGPLKRIVPLRRVLATRVVSSRPTKPPPESAAPAKPPPESAVPASSRPAIATPHRAEEIIELAEAAPPPPPPSRQRGPADALDHVRRRIRRDKDRR